MRTVRDAVFEVLGQFGIARMFANPGSTEVAFLTDLPPDIHFVLALHEGAVIGLATGEAIGSGKPALALLHTTAGYGNAVGAIATATANRAPMVILVGQQDRRHLASEPFLAGKLEDLGGDYPVSVRQPARAQDLPALIARAYHDAQLHSGPAVVLVPMGDWAEPADDNVALAAPEELIVGSGVDEKAVTEVAARIERAINPVLVVGSLTDDTETWDRTARLADRLGCPVWSEAHAARAGFDQTSPQFAGHLPANRGRLRKTLAGHDLVLVLGGPAFRQYLWAEGSFVEPGTEVVVVTPDRDEAAFSAASLAVIAPVGDFAGALTERVRARPTVSVSRTTPALPALPQGDQPIHPGHVFAALRERLPAESTVIEESPSTRGLLLDLMPASRPLGFLTPAMGGLGFALSAATGLKLALPDRPVVAVVGDGASLYNIQAVWSATRYEVGALFVIMSNGGYAVMDRLAVNAGGTAPWPSFRDVSVSAIAGGFGCPTRRVETYGDLVRTLDEVMPTLSSRRQPLLLDVAVSSS